MCVVTSYDLEVKTVVYVAKLTDYFGIFIFL